MQLVTFVETGALPGAGVAAEAYWAGLAGLVEAFGPRKRELLGIRDQMQMILSSLGQAAGEDVATPVVSQKSAWSPGTALEAFMYALDG